MPLYGLTDVRLNQKGRVTRARMQRIDGATNNWIGEPAEYEAREIAKMIVAGDTVYGVFIIPGGTTFGPRFRRVAYDLGSEGIELEQDVEGYRIRDLVLF